MKRIALAAAFVMLGAQADAGILYQQPPDPSGGFYKSAWWDPDGSNYDEYVWDKFVLGSSANVDTIAWRGAYGGTAGGPAVNFTVAVYGSIPGGSQPDFSQPPFFEYDVGGNAGETYAGVFGGTTMYDYRFALPLPFPAQAGVPYWVEIEAWQWGFPDWSIARGTNGDGYHFRCQHNNLATRGVPTGCWFTAPSGDCAFTLLSNAPTDVAAPLVASDFALRGAVPNPSRGDRLQVSFSLPNAAPAELALFDVSGRRVVRRDVGGLGAGAHVVDLAGAVPLAPGVYFARLTQGVKVQMAKVIVGG